MNRPNPTDVASGSSIGERLLEVLGLKDQRVRRIVLDVKANNLVQVTVIRYVTNEQVDAVCDAIATERFKLVRDDGDAEA